MWVLLFETLMKIAMDEIVADKQYSTKDDQLIFFKAVTATLESKV